MNALASMLFFLLIDSMCHCNLRSPTPRFAEYEEFDSALTFDKLQFLGKNHQISGNHLFGHLTDVFFSSKIAKA